MRSLATGPYTNQQVVARLADASYAFGARFEILEADLSVAGELSVDEDTSTPGAVMAALVEMNVDRDVKGSLSLRMVPDQRLVGQLFRKRIKAWWRIQMPDGGIAEFPMGVYVWNVPARSLQTVGIEEWSIVLGDQGHILNAGGPGDAGFTAFAGERITDAITRAVQRIGFADVSGITPLPSLVARDATWGLRDENNQIMTWTRVLTDLHLAAGCYSPVFDLAGRYRNILQPDLTKAAIGWSYEPGQASLLIDAGEDAELDRIGNRVFVVSAAPESTIFGVAVADANALVPGHPLSQGEIGFYIDVLVEDQVAATLVDMQLRAFNELVQRLSFYERMDISTLANPAHESFDVLRVAWPDDLELDVGVRWHERTWSFDLLEARMTHQLRRLTDVA